jgi:hypothetical protein
MKQLYVLTISVLMGFGATAQSFSTSDVTPWAYGATDEVIHSYGDVTNDSGDSKSVHCKRTNVNVGAGTSNYFCWTQCYGPNTDQSPVATDLDAGATSELFGGYYNANGFVGYSIVRYTFFDANNPNDSTSFEVTYSTDPNGVEDVFTSGETGMSAAYPNPANTSTSVAYNLLPGTNDATIEMFDVLGSKVRKIELTEDNGEMKVQLSTIPSGLYFFNLVVDGKTLETRKLMVSH